MGIFDRFRSDQAPREERIQLYDFMTIDFETGNTEMDSACAVGIVAVKNGGIADTFYSLIFTDKFSPENIAVHGITPEDVASSPHFSDLLPTITSYIDRSRLIFAHNAQFDMSVLEKSADKPIPDFPFLDSINYVAAGHPGTPHSLKDCAAHFGIDLNMHHNALADAECCAKIILEATKPSASVYAYIQEHAEARIKAFSALHANVSMPKKKTKSGTLPSYVWLDEKSITADEAKNDPSHPFFGKNIVFTGDLEAMSRKDAVQSVVDIGAVVKTGVSKKVDYVVVGTQDLSIVGADGMSTKERKARLLVEEGENIEILNEQEFLEILHGLR